MHRLARLAIAAAATTCLGSSAASAATIVTTPYHDPDYPAGYNLQRLTFQATPGERNAVRLQYDLEPARLTITDAAAPLRLAARNFCKALDEHTVVCKGKSHGKRYLGDTRFALGDAADTLTARGELKLRSGFLTADGGSGDDTLRGVVGSTLIGGPGHDTLRAETFSTLIDGDQRPTADTFIGSGSDVEVSYAGRKAPVVVDLNQPTGGAAGERDRYEGIDGAAGGDGNDTLTTAASADVASWPHLYGGRGADRLRVVAGVYADVVLDGGQGLDIYTCGGKASTETVFTERGELLTPECDKVQDTDFWAFAPFPATRAGQQVTFERLTCTGPGVTQVTCSGDLTLTDPATGAVIGQAAYADRDSYDLDLTVELNERGRELLDAHAPVDVRFVSDGRTIEWRMPLAVREA